MKWLLVSLLVFAACGGDDTAKPVAELMDPTTCMECHPQHVQQWSGSMHAYASDDPVFVAMNKRGQKDTGGKLGDFCLRCHAPMALALGTATGATFDPATLDPTTRGVTCFFCHNVASITDTHNNGLQLAMDQTMRGGVGDPVKSPAHFSKYDPLTDSDTNNSELCGACHDIVVPQDINNVPNGVAVERTFAEWQGTFFATEPGAQFHFTCGSCHMISKTDVIADAPGLNVKSRANGFHEHAWPAIDQALTPFPETATQAMLIDRDLAPAVRVIGPFNSITKKQFGGICLDPPGRLKIRIDSIGTGHAWPSGASQDRRAWLEVIAKDVDGNVVFQKGVTPDGMDPVDTPGLINVDTFGLWDRVKKVDNTPAHFFWEIGTVQSQLLKIPAVRGEDHSYTAEWDVPSSNLVTHIETRLLIRPVAFEVLNDLVAGGELAADVVTQMKTLEVAGGHSVWDIATKGTGTAMNTNCNPN